MVCLRRHRLVLLGLWAATSLFAACGGKTEVKVEGEGDGDASGRVAVIVGQKFDVRGTLAAAAGTYSLTLPFAFTLDAAGTLRLENFGTATVCLGDTDATGPDYLLRSKDGVTSIATVPTDGYKVVDRLLFPGSLPAGTYELDVLFTGTGECSVSGPLQLTLDSTPPGLTPAPVKPAPVTPAPVVPFEAALRGEWGKAYIFAYARATIAASGRIVETFTSTDITENYEFTITANDVTTTPKRLTKRLDKVNSVDPNDPRAAGEIDSCIYDIYTRDNPQPPVELLKIYCYEDSTQFPSYFDQWYTTFYERR